MSDTTKRLVVFHGSYGCDTGCCGHYITWDDDTHDRLGFTFKAAPSSQGKSEQEYREAVVEWAKAEFGDVAAGCSTADLDWENCRLYDRRSC